MALFWGASTRDARPAGEERFSLSQLAGLVAQSRGDFSSVNAAAGETSLQSVAVRTTADLVCSLASELPVSVVRRDDEKSTVSAPGNLDDPGDDGTGREDWTYRLVLPWLLRGNAYGNEGNYDRRSGRARTLDLIHPDDVSVTVQDGSPKWQVNGEEAGRAFRHMRVNPVPGRVLGLSIVGLHAQTIGVSLAASRYGQQWFADGAHPSGILANDEVKMTAELSRTAKDRFLAALRGSREPLVLGKGWSYEALQVSPNESQFLETQGFTEAQCARMFGPGFAEVLGYDTGGSMDYSNIVNRRQDLLVLSMNKWLRRVERVLSSLVAPSLRVRINREGLLESTTLQRYQAHGLALSSQWLTVNEVREIEGRPPVPWGDEPVMTAEKPATSVGEL